MLADTIGKELGAGLRKAPVERGHSSESQAHPLPAEVGGEVSQHPASPSKWNSGESARKRPLHGRRGRGAQHRHQLVGWTKGLTVPRSKTLFLPREPLEGQERDRPPPSRLTPRPPSEDRRSREDQRGRRSDPVTHQLQLERLDLLPQPAAQPPAWAAPEQMSSGVFAQPAQQPVRGLLPDLAFQILQVGGQRGLSAAPRNLHARRAIGSASG